MNIFSTLRKGLLTFSCIAVCTFSYANNSSDDWWELICPADVTVHCDEELWDLSIYGNAYINSHSGTSSAGAPTVHYYLNSCGTGHIVRTWSAEDPYWNWITCSQTITVAGSGSFGYNDIEWPEDVTLYGCNPNTDPSITGKPWWNYHECSMIGVSYKDMVFTVNNGCKKIMRTWTLMDWCHNGSHHYSTWTHRQFIKIINDEVPQFDCPEDITVSSTNCKNGLVDADPLWIDPSMCGGNYKVTNNSPYAYSNGADISGVYPVGTTKVALTVTFGCNMKRTCWIKVTVENNKPPSPICLGQLNVALMGMDTNDDGINDEGMVDIWAKDLDWKSFSPCGFEPLTFSFAEDSLQMFRRFTCDHLGQNDVKMYVKDRYGNQSFCVVKIDVQNNAANITPCERLVDDTDTTTHREIYLSGKVVNKQNDPIALMPIELTEITSKEQYNITYDTTVTMTVDSFINFSGAVLYFYETDTIITETIDTIITNNPSNETLTTIDGGFLFDSLLQEGGHYRISCPEMDKPLEGIDMNDLNAITEHILGTKPLNSPNDLLAADLNEDQIVDQKDLNLMIDYLKGDIDDFGPNNWMVYTPDPMYDALPNAILSTRNTSYTKDSLIQMDDQLDFVIIQKGDIIEAASDSLIGNENLEFRSFDDQKSRLSVYPNPFTQKVFFNIQSDENDDIATIKLMDIAGRTIHVSEHQLNRGLNQVDLTPTIIENQNVLLYQVTMGNAVLSGKLIHIQ